MEPEGASSEYILQLSEGDGWGIDLWYCGGMSDSNGGKPYRYFIIEQRGKTWRIAALAKGLRITMGVQPGMHGEPSLRIYNGKLQVACFNGVVNYWEESMEPDLRENGEFVPWSRDKKQQAAKVPGSTLAEIKNELTAIQAASTNKPSGESKVPF